MNIDEYLEVINENIEQENYEQVVTLIDEVLQYLPDNYELYVVRANAKHELNQYKEAIEDYEIAIKNNVYLTAYEYSLIGDCKQKLQLHKQAIYYFKEASRMEPEKASYYHSIAWSYFELKDYNNAVEYSSKAVKYDKADSFYNFMYGKCLVKTGKYQDAIAHFMRALMIEPESDLYCLHLVNAYIELNDYENIIKYSKKLIELTDGEDYYPYFCISRALYYLDNYEEALEYANKVIELSPDFPGGYCTIGIIFYKKGDYQNALEYNDKAIRLDNSTTPMLYENKIDYLKALGRLDEIKDVENKLKEMDIYKQKVIEPRFGNANINSSNSGENNVIILK